MPIRTAIWKVGAQPEPLLESSLAKEQLLEDMIVAAPRLLSEDWMLIGRQEHTGFGGRVDLLAIAPDASLVLIELKRDRTPREVVAQAIDYAGWVEKLKPEDIEAIYGRFKPGRSLANDFRQRFGQDLDEENLNQTHQIIIVAASLDPSTERIVAYLSDRDIPINVLCFQVYTNGTEQLLSRTWLLDPVRTELSAAAVASGSTEPWNGEFYCNYGHYEGVRSWEDALEYGFICAGGGSWYTKTLQLLKPGDRVWVKAPGYGFVGVARVTGHSQPASECKVSTPLGERPVLEVAKRGRYHSDQDDEHCEHFVPVKWLQTVPLDKAIKEVGLYGIQHSVCKPTTSKWRQTVERLKIAFPDYDK
ncbi:MAG: endonuclease NucS domain-containing protein [Gemmataceae bacterium]